MGVSRIVPYPDVGDMEASRDFYVGALGSRLRWRIRCSVSARRRGRPAQVIIAPPGFENPRPRFGVDVGEPSAVDAAHEEAVRRGLSIVYPLTDEPWGVRRFFVEDPGGTIVNVLAHVADA
jgi:catechol 2,3-dioxygenase-like lactoylglutathione lyase family enzyme